MKDNDFLNGICFGYKNGLQIKEKKNYISYVIKWMQSDACNIYLYCV